MTDYDILLRDHVTLTCRSIDRLFLQGYVPQLQSVGQVCRFLLGRGYRIPSSAAFGRIGDAYVAELHRWAEAQEIPVIRFAKGEKKEARFGDPRVMALLSALVGFGYLIAGFTNRGLRDRMAALLDADYTSRQATYDLRRLKRKGLIRRLPGRQRYALTPLGRRIAVLFVKTYGRVLAPGLIELDPALPVELARRSPLALAWRRLDRIFEDYIPRAMIAA